MSKVHSGDTIVELMVAFAIFSIAAVTTIAILNQGVAVTQRSLEISLVRQQIDSQAEMIRYAHDSRDPLWITLKSNASLVEPSNLEPINSSDTDCVPVGSSDRYRAFFVHQDNSGRLARSLVFGGRYSSEPASADPEVFAKVYYEGALSRSVGVWVQAIKAENLHGSIDAYDFYIHACWDSVGSSVPVTLGTIVRVYDTTQ